MMPGLCHYCSYVNDVHYFMAVMFHEVLTNTQLVATDVLLLGECWLCSSKPLVEPAGLSHVCFGEFPLPLSRCALC